MLPEVKAIEPALKQVLYHCLEHVQATKAALYLSASHDLNVKQYEIATSYQYTVSDRARLGANDDLVDRLVVKRGAFFVNGLGSDQRFAEMLFRQGSDRILATPLFSRGRLVGFIDMRDKAGKRPFEANDVQAASKIAEQMLQVLSNHNLFGIGPVQLVEEPARSAVAAANQAEGGVARMPALSAAAVRAIEGARQHFARRQLAHAGQLRPATVTDVRQLQLLLPSLLAMPGASIACFTSNDQSAAVTAATLGPLEADAVEQLRERMRQETRGASHVSTAPPELQFILPFGPQCTSIRADALGEIVTAPVAPDLVAGLFVTVAFGQGETAQQTQLVERFLKQLHPLIKASLDAVGQLPDRQLVAERLLEPDFERHPGLVDHSRTVAAIAQRFAEILHLSAAEIETVRIAALVHDVGLRLLDYDRFHNKAALTPEEMKAISEHPVIGAALVEPLLGPEVAQAVLRHHERIDGKGYPSRLTGSQIPLAARIIQIVDAWVAMTSTQSYQPPIGADEAAARIRDAAGSQFDPALADRFLREREKLLI